MGFILLNEALFFIPDVNMQRLHATLLLHKNHLDTIHVDGILLIQ